MCVGMDDVAKIKKSKTGKVNELKICSLTMVVGIFLNHNLVVTFFC
jgi:hypothetical protein